MKVSEFAEKYGLKTLSLPNGEREITCGYIGDLLSWVMGRAKEGAAWITIMSNQNIVAVASLTDVACIILAEDVALEDSIIENAKQKGVNILGTPLPSYEAAALLVKEGI